MTQRWWVAVVAGAGILLAILLFPRPDTGDDPVVVSPVPVQQSRPPSAAAADRPGALPPAVHPDLLATGPRPDAAEYMARKATPEATTANLLIGPVSSFKYTIRKQGPPTEEVPAIEEKIDATVEELRAVREDPEARPWSEIEASVDALLAMVTESSYGTNPDVVRSVERTRMLLAQYHTGPSPTTPGLGVPPSGAEE